MVTHITVHVHGRFMLALCKCQFCQRSNWVNELGLGSLDPTPSDLCILMEGLVRDDHVGVEPTYLSVGSPQSHHDNDLQPLGISVVERSEV